MKKNEVKKFAVKNFDDVREHIAVVCEVLEDRVIIFNTKAQTLAISLDKIVEEKSVRIPSETRAMLKSFVKIYDEEAKLREKLAEVQSRKGKINPEALAKSMGLLTGREFADVFVDNLSEDVKRLWEENHYRAYFYDFGEEPTLEIECEKHIKKYFREGSFVYEEYDGTIMMITDAEKDKNYKAYVAKHRKDLPIKMKAKARLDLGDKDWLICTTSYEMKVAKPLTEKYAKELAERFCRV